MSVNKIPTHLFAGFLGTGKTTALRSLMAQKPADEQWLIVVNEFGEIGIDGAVLSDNGIPVAEIAGGCLCCSAGGQMGQTLRTMLQRSQRPQRIIIEASGLAHAAGVIDELKSPELRKDIEVAAAFAVVDPRQFIDDAFFRNPLYQDQIGVCDVLMASKTDLCSAEVLEKFRERAAALFPPKALIAETVQAQAQIAWLDTPVTEKPRYRVKNLPDNRQGFQSQGFTFPAERNFDGEKLTRFFDDLPALATRLMRAKGVFRVMDTWVWLNWTDGQWGANQVSWRRDSRFELIAEAFDSDEIERHLQAALED
ncbi:GTP-binding protein [Conchiformibius steedae DSM 2580]|uniref:GTP-binding protein n=1 Tax=Conchiformibius steedae DSM 2580 TaxID=1121352 RepID=A0AAE9KZ88_9NEIS|nr:GTP-binding protein [Conchiformibius steedae]QMT34003.1 GTP-binding protein [Conchiformibius steedae]URD66774.1 GTP-binding protein [Conchiformibius steedae DSM 2580]